MADEQASDGTVLVTRDERGRVRPGSVLNPLGRRRGSRNVFGDHFVADLFDHWKQHGRDAIEKLYAENLPTYFRVISRVIPQHVDLTDTTSPLADLTDDQLEELGAYLSERIARRRPPAEPAKAVPSPPVSAWPDVSRELDARQAQAQAKDNPSPSPVPELVPYRPPPRRQTFEDTSWDPLA